MGRCDLIKEKFLIDVAHNEKAVDNLKKFIEEKKLNKKDISIIFHCSESKDTIKFVGPLRTFISNFHSFHKYYYYYFFIFIIIFIIERDKKIIY